ncbi:replicative DNA helicase [Izhakiella capsodis]|uniref:DNA 5'-3' helicase n=1 Tax=Izhakiella capsodis TaxID=1367852 RepID=A0A1I5BQL1_9GAMM|nr:DnaB-like helicase C-terminal domain-containing protein [Izhakiella capsodis]SFN76962.1 replicative DNA helicase [Izhakiella capsodis]
MNSYETEELLIGAMMLKGDHIDCREIAGKLPSEAFENAHLRSMYRVITSLLDKAEPVDVFSVQNGVREETKSFVLDVFQRQISAANIRAWAKRVRRNWMSRKAIADMTRAIYLLENASVHNADDIAREVAHIIGGIKLETSDRLPRRIGDMLGDYLDVLDRRMKGAESGLYLQTGITPLDEAYGGFDRTDLIIIAARPGMGKTELAVNIANSIGRQNGKGLLISMEMSDMQIVERHVADRAGLSLELLRNPLNMLDEQYTRLTAATGTLLDENNHVLSGSFSVDEIIAQAERMNADAGLSFLAIDYLTLIKRPKDTAPHTAIAEITGKLKQFCLRQKVPVILLSQLNRGPESRVDKRPNLGDLRESGSIEQDADVIIFPYRDEVYNKNSEMRGVAEIIIGKYRSGQPRTFFMGWNKGHFVNIDQTQVAHLYSDNKQKQFKTVNDWRGG